MCSFFYYKILELKGDTINKNSRYESVNREVDAKKSEYKKKLRASVKCHSP